jgi:3-methyladenine DNA glycosylase/8-oxoguanine DNA glycosylase
MRRIKTIDLKEGVAALIRSCGHLARVYAFAGEPPLRPRPAGFKGLSRVIVGQQFSVASAKAIWGRLEARAQPFTAASFLTLPDRDLRGAGLSLRVEVKDTLALEARPDHALMMEIAECWRPWRAIAVRMLWSYYALRRKPVDVPA